MLQPHVIGRDFQSNALGVVRFLFWGTIVTCLALLATDPRIRSLARRGWKVMFCALILTLLSEALREDALPTIGGIAKEAPHLQLNPDW